MPTCAGVRRWGSAVLDMAYVAAGRYEGYWERSLNAWDVAAGEIIVKEAGGLCQALDADDSVVESGTVVCGNEVIFEKFAKLIRT
jgi:myo-inositol-1(or 4)-monophosphatase